MSLFAAASTALTLYELLFTAIIPLFVGCASSGLMVRLGLAQLAFLIAGQLMYWPLTRGARRWRRVGGALLVWGLTNLIFTYSVQWFHLG
jgi:hypothetical protein